MTPKGSSTPSALAAWAGQSLFHSSSRAKALGCADPYGVMPHEYAYRLRLREAQKNMPINQGGEVTEAAFRKVFGNGGSG